MGLLRMSSHLLVVALLLASLAIDFGNSSSRSLHSTRYRARRLVNWLPVAIAYSGFYLGRYNVASINVEAVRQDVGVTEVELGAVITAGMWTYALTAPFTGRLVNVLGARRSMLLGTGGSGLANLAVVFVWRLLPSDGTSKSLGLSALFGLNMFFQGFGTASTMRLVSSWYAPQERGLFTALLNVWITFGRFLANALEVHVAQDAGWPYVFSLPGLLQLCCFAVIYGVVRSTPEEAGFQEDAEPAADRYAQLLDEAPSCAESALELQTKPKRQCCAWPRATDDKVSQWGALLSHPLFPVYVVATFCLPWSGDGFTTWILAFLEDRGLVNEDGTVWLNGSGTSLPPNESVGFAVWAGAAFGGVVLGTISDRFFRGSRLEPLIFCTFLQAYGLYLVYWLGEAAAGPWLCTGIIFMCCFFILGNYSLLSYAVPVDFGVELASLCGGVQTFAGYLGSGIGGALYAELITRFGYVSWFVAMEAATCVTACVLIVGRIYRANPSVK